MKESGAEVLSVLTDVSKASDVEVLVQKTLNAFGAVHLLCNNAGVSGGTSIWESTLLQSLDVQAQGGLVSVIPGRTKKAS